MPTPRAPPNPHHSVRARRRSRPWWETRSSHLAHGVYRVASQRFHTTLIIAQGRRCFGYRVATPVARAVPSLRRRDGYTAPAILRPANGDRDCERTVIGEAYNLEEHRGLRTHTE